MSGVIGGAGSKSGIVNETELDYEEGTWSPVLSDGTNNATMNSGSTGASYIKVGKLTFNPSPYFPNSSIHIHIYISVCLLLNYNPSRTLEQGSLEIYNSLKSGQISDSIETITLKWYQHIQSDPELLKKHSINGKFL